MSENAVAGLALNGFDDAEEMREWFMDTHGLPTPLQPFVGTRIVWR